MLSRRHTFPWTLISFIICFNSIEQGQFAPSGDLIFVTDTLNDQIYASSLPETGPKSLSAVNVTERIITPYAIGLEYDPEQDIIYWSDTDLKSIQRARYDGTDNMTVIADTISYGLAIDLASRRMFWTDNIRKRIEVVYLNGTGRSSVVSDGLGSPRAIVADSLHGLLFWTDSGVDKIERANMDGSNRLTVIGNSLYTPFGMAIDAVGQKLYWCEYSFNKLETSDLFGNFREILLQGSSVTLPYYVAVHAEYLYWTDTASGYLKRINRYEIGGSAEQVGSRLGTGIHGLHVYEVDECSSSPCQNNGSCMDFVNSFQCSCPEGCIGTLCEVDNERPSMICPIDIDISTDSSQATVTWLDPVVIDNVDNGLSAICNQSCGSAFNVGSTVVICSAIDAAGNEANCTFTVDVEGISSASSTGYLIAVVVIFLVIILVMSPAFIFFCRFYYSQKNKIMEHSTGMKKNDYDDDDDDEVPKSTTNAADNTGYEIPMQIIGDNDAAAPPKLESQRKVDSAFEEKHEGDTCQLLT